MATYSNTAREVEMPNGDVVVIHNAPTGGENTTSNIKKFKYDDNGHVTESTAANATDLNLSSYSTPTTGTTDIGTSDTVQTAIGKLDHQSHIDQSNILYAAETGVKNRIILNDTFSIAPPETTGLTVTNNGDGTITVSGTPTSTNADAYVYITIGNFYYSADKYRIENQHIGTNGYYYTNDTHLNSNVESGMEYTYTSAGSTPVVIRLTKNTTYPSQVVYPMIRPAFITDTTFQQGALPNYDLTRLEAEDRASLAEVVDSGAKNELQPTWTTQEINGVKFTVGSDGVITATTTGTRTSAAIYPLLSRYSGTKMTGKVMSISPKGGTNASYYVAAEQADSPWHNVGTDYGDGVVISSEANNKDINVNIVIPANYSPNNLKFSPMLCTKAAFGVSSKFVPYRPNWDLVASRTNDNVKLIEDSSNGSIPTSVAILNTYRTLIGVLMNTQNADTTSTTLPAVLMGNGNRMIVTSKDNSATATIQKVSGNLEYFVPSGYTLFLYGIA